MSTIVELARFGNQFFDSAEPWKSRKEDPERAAADISSCLELAFALGVLMYPVTPEGSMRLLGMFGRDGDDPPAAVYETLGTGRLFTGPLAETAIPFERVRDEDLPSMVESVMRDE